MNNKRQSNGAYSSTGKCEKIINNLMSNNLVCINNIIQTMIINNDNKVINNNKKYKTSYIIYYITKCVINKIRSVNNWNE